MEFLKELMEQVTEKWRDRGREVERSEEGLMLWIKVFKVSFADFKDSLMADARKDSAEVCRDERSLFSIGEGEGKGEGEIILNWFAMALF